MDLFRPLSSLLEAKEPQQNDVFLEFGDFGTTAEPDAEKGGVKLTPYVTYNCLSISEDGMADVFMSNLRTFWTCDICEMRLPLTFQEKTAHRQVIFREFVNRLQHLSSNGLPPSVTPFDGRSCRGPKSSISKIELKF